MKIFAFKYSFFIIILSTIFIFLDILLISYCGIEKQFLVFLYAIIGIIPLCGIISLAIGMVPKIIIDKVTNTIKTVSVLMIDIWLIK